MKWLGHRARKLIVGVVIGAYAVVDTFFPVLGAVFTNEPVARILKFLLSETGETFVFKFIKWRKD